jgi:hypothetical protein
MVSSHTRSPLGRAPGFTLTPGIFVIPGDFSFVLLCTHRAPGSSCPVCLFRKYLQLLQVPSDWAQDASNRCIGPLRSDCRSDCYRNHHDLSYQKPLHSIQLQEGFADPNLALESIALDLEDRIASTTTSIFEPTRPPLFEF